MTNSHSAPRRTAVVAVLAALTTTTPLLAVPPAHAAHGYDHAHLQRNVNAVAATGVVGVLGEVVTPSGRIRARSGVANRTKRAPVPLNGHFRIGSTTKTFVATVVLQLVGEGKLSLDDTVAKWLPGTVDGNGNDGRKITIRQLLQHTSGLADYTRDLIERIMTVEGWRRERLRTWSPEQLVALALRHQPAFTPGTRWSYSSTGYLLAGMVIRKVTGHTWQQEVHRRILAPLNLRHTTTPGVWPFVPNPHARAYQRFKPGGPLTEVTVQNPRRPVQ